jgi:hypothetical protein
MRNAKSKELCLTMIVKNKLHEYLDVRADKTRNRGGISCMDAVGKLGEAAEASLPPIFMEDRSVGLDSTAAGLSSAVIPLPMPAVTAPCGTPGMVSVITPTYNRDKFLIRALTCFRHQDYKNIEWLILDDSPQKTEALNDLQDANVFYQHIDRKLSIGEKRNILIERSKGEIIIQFDDDDYYAPSYVSFMVSTLASLGADMINLRGWFLYDVRSHFFGYWDLMQKEGSHYCCDQAGVTLGILDSENNRALENNHLGYGFSYAFKRKVWEAAKFPTIDWNEDGEFSLKAKSKFKVEGVHDTTGLCLHFLHPASTSRCFPQHHLPRFLVEILFPTLDHSTLVDRT